MSLLTKAVPITLVAIGAGVIALASDNSNAETVEMSPSATAFASADIDENGTLSAPEFITFAELLAGQGDADYTALTESGDYDLAFAERDINADGALDKGELGLLVTTDHSPNSYNDSYGDKPETVVTPDGE